MIFSGVSVPRSNSLRGLRWKLYAFSFFDEFILIYPLYALMFQAHGLSGAQISSLLIVLSAVIFVLQIPAGSVADLWSRRSVLLVAVLARALAFGCWMLFPNYAGFLAGFVLWGFKRAFVSGTLEAFVYDELRRFGRIADYAKVTGQMQTYSLFGFVLGGLGASALASYGYTLILACSIAAVCASAAAIYLLPFAPAVARVEKVRYLQTLRAGVRVAVQNPLLLFVIAYGSVVGGFKVVDEYYNLFLSERHFTNGQVALWIAVIYVFGTFGSTAAHRMENKKLPAATALVVWAALLLLATVLPAVLAPVAIGLFAAQYYAMSVLINAALQHIASDETRATTTSLMSFVSEFLSLAVYAIFVATSAHGYIPGLRTVATTVACLGAVCAAVIWAQRRK